MRALCGGAVIVALLSTLASLGCTRIHVEPATAADVATAPPHRGAEQYRRPFSQILTRDWGRGEPKAKFFAQVHVESAWDTQAVSPAGATGLAQFMPGTAAWIQKLYPKELECASGKGFVVDRVPVDHRRGTHGEQPERFQN